MNEKRKQKGFTLIELLIVVAIIGIIAAIAVPGLKSAIDQARQKSTMSNLKQLGQAMERYYLNNTGYPEVDNITALIVELEAANYINGAPDTDGWKNELLVNSTRDLYTLCSGGKDGGTCLNDGAGATDNFNAAIVFSNNRFVQWPDGQQK